MGMARTWRAIPDGEAKLMVSVTASAVVGGGVEWRRRTGKLTNRDLATSFGLLPTTSALLRSSKSSSA
jgi:hypothetical protein